MAVTLVSITLGALSFLNVAKRAVPELLQDLDRYHNDHMLAPRFLGQVDIVICRLSLWRAYWRVNENTSDTLLVQYWNHEGKEIISKLVQHVCFWACRLLGDIERRYGVQIDYLMTDGDIELRRRQEDFLTVPRLSRFRRLRNAIFTSHIFEEHLTELTKCMDVLEQVSQRRYLVQNPDRMGLRGDELPVRLDQMHDFLKRKAYKTTMDFDALQRYFSGHRDHNVDIQLSHGRPPSSRLTLPDDYEDRSSVPFHLTVSTTHRGVVRCFFVESADVGNEFRFYEEDGHGNECPFRSSRVRRLPLHHPDFPNTAFIFRRRSIVYEQYETLRNRLVSMDSNWSTNLHGEFTKIQRTQLAYELSECALLLLKSSLWTKVCSCCIYILQNGTYPHPGSFSEFTLRFQNVIHDDPELRRPWCARRWRNMPLLRIGVLLVEIALGKFVRDAGFRTSTMSIEIDFDIDYIDPDATEASDLEGILEMVKNQGSTDFSHAINYCLTKTISSDQISDRDIDEFYREVVKPLSMHHSEESEHLETMNRRRRLRL